MLNNNLVSIIIPIYNVESYISEAIYSVCNQSYKNLQIIIVDDCSTDNTYKLVNEISKQDSRILLLRNKINSKIVKTLNHGLKYAKGDYIARMDGDDISSLERIEKLLNFLINNPSYDLVGSHVHTIDENSNLIGSLKLPTDFSTLSKTLKYTPPILHIWLARAKVYKQLGGYREIPGAEDYDFLLRMYSLSMKFTNLDSYEYYVRIRNGNTTTTIGFYQRLMSNYVVELFNERKIKGEDSYSDKNLKEYIESNIQHKEKFEKSNIYLRKAFRNKVNGNYIKMLFFVLISVCTSKYQFQYLLKRLIFKILL